MFTLTTYTWCGKTFKTLDGLCKRAFREFPGCGVSFSKDHMVLSWRDHSALAFARTFDASGNSIIATDHDVR